VPRSLLGESRLSSYYKISVLSLFVKPSKPFKEDIMSTNQNTNTLNLDPVTMHWTDKEWNEVYFAGFTGNPENFKTMKNSEGKLGIAIYVNDGERFHRVHMWGARAEHAKKVLYDTPRKAHLRIRGYKQYYRDNYGKIRYTIAPNKIEMPYIRDDDEQIDPFKSFAESV